MRRSLTQGRLAICSLCLGMFAAIPGCAGSSSSVGNNNSSSAGSSSAGDRNSTSTEKSLFLVGALALDASQCVAKPDTNALLLSAGTMDLAFTSSYIATVLVGNPFGASGSVETKRVSLRGADITLTTIDGAVLGDYSTVGAGFIDAAPAGSAAYTKPIAAAT